MLVLISRSVARARLRLARALRHPSRRLLACLAALAVAAALAAVAAVRRRHAQRRARASFASLFGDAAGDDAQAAACLAGRVACACEYICSEQGCLLSPGRFGAVGVPGTCVRASSGSRDAAAAYLMHARSQEARAEAPPWPRRCHAAARSPAACAARCALDAAGAFTCGARVAHQPPPALPALPVPNVVHWVWPAAAAGEPFLFWHLLHAAAIVDMLSPDVFYLHHPAGALPGGRWWPAGAALVTAAPHSRVRSVYGSPVLHPAHASDVARLAALLSHGGMYLDCDVLPLRPFTPLRRGAGATLAVQSAGRTANAVVLAPRGAPFLRRWADGYHGFDGGADWDKFSVRLPAALAERFPDEVSLLPAAAWFAPGPDDHPGAALFERNITDAQFAAQPHR